MSTKAPAAPTAPTDSRASTDPPTGGTLAQLEAQLAEATASAADADRERLDLEEQLREAQARGASTMACNALRQRAFDAAARRAELSSTRETLARAVAVRTRPLRDVESAHPSQLADHLELAERALATAQAGLAHHDAARVRLLDQRQSAEAIRRHDDARADRAIMVEQAARDVASLERALAARRTAWPALHAAFDQDLGEVRRACVEGAKVVRRLMEKLFPSLADELSALRELDLELEALRARARMLGRDPGEVPPSPNEMIRPGHSPLWSGIEPHAEVRLPGSGFATLWPRSRGGRETPAAEAKPS
ncbi:MAG: hypothetical protein ACREL3_08140 [Gemmatimonadales bacterium]